MKSIGSIFYFICGAIFVTRGILDYPTGTLSYFRSAWVYPVQSIAGGGLIILLTGIYFFAFARHDFVKSIRLFSSDLMNAKTLPSTSKKR